MTETIHPGFTATSEPEGDEVRLTGFALNGPLVMEKIVLRSLAIAHGDVPQRSRSEIQAEIQRLNHKSARYMSQGRTDAAADYESDAAILRWVLGLEDEDTPDDSA